MMKDGGGGEGREVMKEKCEAERSVEGEGERGDEGGGGERGKR